MILRLIMGVIILWGVSCSTTETERIVDKPKDYSEVIKEIEKTPEIKPETKEKIVRTIKEQTQYSQNVYDRLLELEKNVQKLNTEIAELKEQKEALEKRNRELEAELSTWRSIKMWFWAFVIIASLAVLYKFLSPVLGPLIKRGMGIPV